MDERKCGWCGADIASAKLKTKFCSKRCSGLSRYEDKVFRCNFCLADFNPTKASDRFCSAICREEYLAGNRRAQVFDVRKAVRACGFCGATFIPVDIRESYCSSTCKKDKEKEYARISGNNAIRQKIYRSKNIEKVRISSRKQSKDRYRKIKSDPEKYKAWCEKMKAYSTRETRREAQRRRNAARALSAILLPVNKTPEV